MSNVFGYLGLVIGVHFNCFCRDDKTVHRSQCNLLSLCMLHPKSWLFPPGLVGIGEIIINSNSNLQFSLDLQSFLASSFYGYFMACNFTVLPSPLSPMLFPGAACSFFSENTLKSRCT